ncbi:MAG: hypothetical protein UV61_C0006G0013 [Candidatus Gottesmanbacteria bacterium GW2011_GWB1_43_11]|uniref:Uncharacterized protein n=1 Tax=Candidatus Gottesmanbacteria bacterium GW2011_GWB1_43_11 TaxID=1618446 RepID=A0A0G1CMV1_9BACT|nr:MAG: hypothetical protein UV04_C0005G0013 [Candidatus Gottesmanbacteria bacterium GW2011_GWA2_42_16]KKS55406.1 MAG: hypothetical protein UV17_C0011G0031 [Candidatus Gottesmanbacteria bacterium GW2011_GWA1_42_26]KKS81892.1 MAG: hypothetical protein UV55_C0007G0013 [Candidatus Gottesmanbacteria bacterium GW2011_GWC1_43_10]KKS86812.1 MAG: hypothetical protein UV61_C0006G0013 [Candidatus Gottesmanbacteria bacterium GW2011_GWB1_43_11]OGG10606.1 MAG: hypothetical protein A2699_01805 [Candidatus Go
MLQIPVVQNIVNIIIDHQRAIIGPLALEQASRVPGVKIAGGEHVEVEAGINPQSLLNQLVKQYETLFGLASVEVCKDAVKELKPTVSANDLPEILR